jgi:diketogulonate reductase-like aldo/keto reductase
MTCSNSTIKLRNGVEIPIIGYGTSRFGHKDKITDELCKDCIKSALEIGYATSKDYI